MLRSFGRHVSHRFTTSRLNSHLSSIHASCSLRPFTSIAHLSRSNQTDPSQADVECSTSQPNDLKNQLGSMVEVVVEKDISEEAASSKRLSSIKDAKYVFEQAWKNVEKAYNGRENFRFPNEIIWLMGAPGSGKGTNTPAILQARGITNPPIVISDLLRNDANIATMNKGEMISDAYVLELLLKALLDADSKVGVLIDGFPRTEVQVECLKLLYDKMHELRTQFFKTPLRDQFRRPIFRITVLYVEESESVRRQLKRGQKVKEHNKMVRKTGQGNVKDERITDNDENLIRTRYKIFTRHFGALMMLKKLFPFHLINAVGPIDEVMRAIWKEFEYQSSLELDQDTYDAIQHIPIASKIGVHARQELVRRLETYQILYQDELEKCVKVIEREFIPIIKKHAIGGHSLIRTENSLLNNPRCIDIFLDVLSERGYRVSVDPRIVTVPIKVDPKTYEIISERKNVWIFDIRFPQHLIRGTYGTQGQLSDESVIKDIVRKTLEGSVAPVDTTLEKAT